MPVFPIINKMRNFLFLLIPLLSFSACYYDVEETLYAGLECETESVQYSDEIRLILDNSCMICHNAASNFGNIKLETYEQVVQRVEDGRLLGAIRHESGFSPMPQGNPKLSDCQIAQIEAWIDEGYPQN